VVHDAWRDQYQLPGAFAEAGLLERFVTDWYTPADRPLWASAVRNPLGGLPLGLRTRFSPLVPSAVTADEKGSFLAGLLRRKWKHEPFNDVIEGAKSGRRAAEIANATGSNLLAASYSAAAAFRDLKPGLARILFQVHPQPRFLRDLYQRQMAKDADYSELIEENECSVDEQTMASWEQEARLADHILCASSFSKRSLVWSGIPAERISVVPYGVDTTRFEPADVTTVDDRSFKVLFVGQRVARKGLRTLLRLWKKLQPRNAELILAGGHQSNEHIMADFHGLYTDIPRMSDKALMRLYKGADAFVLPSLAEGFGHVYLEALACGTPVLCTENTGAADLVVNGENGWTIPAGDADALEAQLLWMLGHREEVRAMRNAARASAERHTWFSFRESVREIACDTAARCKTRLSPRQFKSSFGVVMKGRHDGA
jgi:glycosyltransferase involved in cell wall biosynthesis